MTACTVLRMTMSDVKRLQAWRPVDLAFLALALLVHAVLLLVPLKAWKAPLPEAAPRLTVDLRQLPPPNRPPEAQPEKQPSQPATASQPVLPEPPPPEPPPVERRSARIALEDLPEPARPQQPEDSTPEPPPLSATQLREIVRQAELRNEATVSTRQLGTARPWQPPANWDRNAGAPYLAESDNRFNDMTVPEEVEIVDRWLAADGSHNVVLNLPNGETLCGRAEAYNPMQPLVEPVMMFRPCGGGGKRTFSMPERYHKGR